MSVVRTKFAFPCRRESDHLPALDPEADQLFKYGRYLQKLDGPNDSDEVARYYRIAAAHGHYKANHNLQSMLADGLASPNRSEEIIDLIGQSVRQDVPTGYYDMGYSLLYGYGMKQDDSNALRYLRKAADMGNSDAQNYVGDLLIKAEREIGKQMLACAMEQGNGDAANNLAEYYAVNENVTAAVSAHQKGVQGGNADSAFILESGFKGLLSPGNVDYFALPNDPERARRYELIRSFIDNNKGRNPKVPDIDQIVPLPPAKLPAWDGTFQWQKEQDAAPPQKPSDKLIERLSKDKDLDPATGLPLTASTTQSAQTARRRLEAWSQADMSAVRVSFPFTCTHEADRLPPLDVQADELFEYGHYLEGLDGPKDLSAIARYYRIAAAHGHYKAMHNLQRLVWKDSASSPTPARETIDLVGRLMNAGVPDGYIDMSGYLDLDYSVQPDKYKALRYLRKAADLGSPEAQVEVGDILEPVENAPEIAEQMYRCSADEGYARGASRLGIYFAKKRRYPEAIEAFQKGVEAGSMISAMVFESGFGERVSRDDMEYVGLPGDPERARRYRAIAEFMRVNDGHNPKVPDIDQIVPLPPAQLPPWDGTFQWQREQNATVPPQKPSDELIERLSKDKNLDPATGLPMTGSASKGAETDQPANATGRL
ncbi:DUF6396 domain-containing protein [Burkholderia sp. L27(2015)]|uniref:DUF6396 domain-containing protein n=1 Tax=Burkholderia sp. L27(2015) TaxID=1641858 RepID=UPI0020B11544|nr:DUF6396 domain-containing protein [Burkholderia sp. L27(2015)]